ncbi:MAG: tRNA (adenosine(37)-N6)-threonylcarbamoyltransferase complex ATPase subunit type 1 TsaE [Muribaculaceae bacterium]|nr:tRNA (adenosine(37)-N6)-threonylcarbamoyltransferase complex ATPase subunit type 1 TsaE [Muribaculaceae bacterium]
MEIIYTLDRLPEAARRFCEAIGSRRVFAFHGAMGAGKTTLIAAICRCLGAEDDFGSPTFSIINEYTDKEGNPIYHFDFYRIDSLSEAIDMGAEEYFYSGDLCLMEWPERIGEILPEETVDVDITVNPDGSRTLRMTD